jgi:nitrogen fixation-related uncharacterized protein
LFRRAIAVQFDDQKRFAEGVLEQAKQHADLAGADHASFVGAITQGHEPRAKTP